MDYNELIGPALDEAVMQVAGLDYDITPCGPTTGRTVFDVDGLGWDELYSPSTNWLQGGPIIEAEGIAIALTERRTEWYACPDLKPGAKVCYGPTPLIAAMRAYVASRNSTARAD